MAEATLQDNRIGKEVNSMESERLKILQGDALTMLKTLPDECCQTVVTSPPYW